MSEIYGVQSFPHVINSEFTQSAFYWMLNMTPSTCREFLNIKDKKILEDIETLFWYFFSQKYDWDKIKLLFLLIINTKITKNDVKFNSDTFIHKDLDDHKTTNTKDMWYS